VSRNVQEKNVQTGCYIAVCKWHTGYWKFLLIIKSCDVERLMAWGKKSVRFWPSGFSKALTRWHWDE